MKPNEIKWIHEKPSEFKLNQLIQMKSTEVRWNQVTSSEIKWKHVKSNEFKWIQTNSSEIDKHMKSH